MTTSVTNLNNRDKQKNKSKERATVNLSLQALKLIDDYSEKNKRSRSNTLDTFILSNEKWFLASKQISN